EFGRARVEKGRTQHQVLGRIPTQRKLGRYDQRSAIAAPLANRMQQRACVAFDVAKPLVQLRHRDPHRYMLARTTARALKLEHRAHNGDNRVHACTRSLFPASTTGCGLADDSRLSLAVLNCHNLLES